MGGGWQGRDVVHGEEGVIVLAETDPAPDQFPRDARGAVEPVGRVAGEKRGPADQDRSEPLGADIEVVMGEAAGRMRQDAVVGVLRGILRHAAPEGAALFHALEDEVDSERILLHHPSQGGQNVIFLANTFSRPLHRDPGVAGKGLQPVLVVVGARAENFLAH